MPKIRKRKFLLAYDDSLKKLNKKIKEFIDRRQTQITSEMNKSIKSLMDEVSKLDSSAFSFDDFSRASY